MARSSGPAFIEDLAGDYRAIEQEYRELLDRTLPPADLPWEPVRIGPTWQYDDGWSLPEASLGWAFLSWTTFHLRGKARKHWWWTPEQARFLLWYYAVDSNGDLLCRSARLQRLKGWGKDPTAAGIAIGSLHAPVMFDRWEGDRPVGRDDPEAWTQIAAVSQDQTKNTFKLFPALIPRETRERYGIQIGKLNVWSDGDLRQIEGISTAADSNEGGRPHQIIRSETQNWLSTNGGHDLAGAMDGNAAKAETGSPARILDIFNAYRPGRDSVAEKAHEGWEASTDDHPYIKYGVMWDSLEAPPNAPLTKEAAPEVIRCIAGDATWLDTRPKGTIMESILNPDNSTSESRRKWYNQIVGTEDAWAQPAWVDKNCPPRIEVQPLEKGDRVVLFGDGSKSDDDTGLLACRLSDGFIQTLHHQHPGKDDAGKPLLVDRNLLDAAVTLAFDTYKVVAFYFDPSHAKADDAIEDDRFWWPMVDKWHERYKSRLDKKYWPIKSGPKAHSVAFDMSVTQAQQLHQAAVALAMEDLEAGEAPHHGGATLKRHMKNARLREGRFGYVIGKESRSSTRKVDLAVCFVGARMLWRIVRLNRKSGSGKGRVLVLE